MPLILLPQQLVHRSELYHQLASLTAAGVGLITACKTLASSPPARSFRKPIEKLITLLEQGSTFSDALQQLGSGRMPAFDQALIHAGEQSGRLDICFRVLSNYYQERARLARQVLSNLAYPAFMCHLAILIFPTQMLSRLVWQGDATGYILAKASILVPIYFVVFMGLYLGQAKHGAAWRACIEAVLRPVPVLGAARRNLALARISMALESLVSAGVSIVEAWPMAAAASGSPAFQRVVHSWAPKLESGQTPAEVVRESKAFPDTFTNLYATGEVSGQLDDTLTRLHQYYQQEASRQLELVAQWAPRLVYFFVLLAIAYQILSFWTGYFSQIKDLTS